MYRTRPYDNPYRDPHMPPPRGNPYRRNGGGDNGGNGGGVHFPDRPGIGQNATGTVANQKSQAVVMLMSLMAMTAWYLTPISEVLVDMLLAQVPIEADLELGRRALQELPYRTVHHPTYTPLVRAVGWDLIESTSSEPSATSSKYEWDFGIIEDPKLINAFALPGGIVRVSTALLDQLDLTRGEVAALLGHEIGHVLHRHSQARVIQQKVVQTMLKNIVKEGSQEGQNELQTVGNTVGKFLLSSANFLGQQAFSRKDEYQADETGWDLLVQSQKYNPRALRSLLTKLWEYNDKINGKTSWESTHPGTLDRIDALDAKWDALSRAQRRTLSRRTV